jgi:hypothetical protein
MVREQTDECCPLFEPGPWDEETIIWKNKMFIKDRVRCFLHIPINIASVLKRGMEKIAAADVESSDMIILSDDNSLWGADIYISVDANVPNAEMATLTGAYLSKVFEGPYNNMRQWMNEMDSYVKAQGKTQKSMLSYYTTCPKCAKKYGKNYVVLLSVIE